MAFAVEFIPHEDILYRHVPNKPRDFWVPEQNRPSSAVFKDKHRRASVNWAKYRTAEGSVRPNSMAVVSVLAGECRACVKEVEHTPVEMTREHPANQAHAEVCEAAGRQLSNREYAESCDELARRARVAWPSDGKVLSV